MRPRIIRPLIAPLTFAVGLALTAVWPLHRHFTDTKTTAHRISAPAPLECAALVARAMGPDSSYTLSEVAVRYAEVGQFEKALSLVGTVEDDAERAVGTAKIAARLWAGGQRDRALKLFASIELAGPPGGAPKYRAYVLGQIAEELAAAKQYERVIELAALGTDDYLIRTALDALVGNVEAAAVGTEESRVLSRAIQLTKRLKDGEEGRVIQKIAVAYAKAGRYDDALRLAEGVTGDGDEMGNFDRDETLKILAVMLAEEGMYDRAVRVAERTDDYFREGALIEIAGRQIDAGRADLALNLLPRVLRPLLRELDGTQYEADRLTEIGLEYARAGRKARAAEVLAKAFASADSNSDWMDRALSLSKLAVTSAEAGLYEQAIKAASAVRSHETQKVAALAGVSVRMVKAGHYDEALGVVETIRALPPAEQEVWKADGLVDVGDALLTAGRRDAGLVVLRRSFEIAGGVGRSDFKPRVLEKLAETYARHGEYERAFEVVAATEELFYKAHALMDIGVTQLRSGRELDDRSRDALNRTLPRD